MTPSMRLSDILRTYHGDPDYEEIARDLNEAFALGHEFGLARAVEEVAALDRFGTILRRVRGLKVERVKNVPTISEDL